MAEVSVPYRDGPLDGERELLADWELEEGAPGSTDGSIYEHPQEWLTYVSRHVGWEYRYVGIAGEDAER